MSGAHGASDTQALLSRVKLVAQRLGVSLLSVSGDSEIWTSIHMKKEFGICKS